MAHSALRFCGFLKPGNECFLQHPKKSSVIVILTGKIKNVCRIGYIRKMQEVETDGKK
jgi:hypothetical protein